MTKKKTTHPIHMHVPTKIGFTVVGIAVLVYVLFITTSYNTNNQTQTYQSQASSLPCTIHGCLPEKPKVRPNPPSKPKGHPTPTPAPKHHPTPTPRP